MTTIVGRATRNQIVSFQCKKGRNIRLWFSFLPPTESTLSYKSNSIFSSQLSFVPFTSEQLVLKISKIFFQQLFFPVIQLKKILEWVSIYRKLNLICRYIYVSSPSIVCISSMKQKQKKNVSGCKCIECCGTRCMQFLLIRPSFVLRFKQKKMRSSRKKYASLKNTNAFIIKHSYKYSHALHRF